MQSFSSLLLCLVALISCVYVVESVTGEIISCPGCKLNKLPEVRKFFKGAGQADSYNDLKITFIQGRNPDLLVKDDAGNLIERIDLSRMTNADIHALMSAKGFTRKADAPPLFEDTGIQPEAAAVATSDVNKVGSLSSGIPIQRDITQGLTSRSGGKLRKRHEALMSARVHGPQISADATNRDAAAGLRS